MKLIILLLVVGILLMGCGSYTPAKYKVGDKVFYRGEVVEIVTVYLQFKAASHYDVKAYRADLKGWITYNDVDETEFHAFTPDPR